jgi:Rha family phage regulatory protein
MANNNQLIPIDEYGLFADKNDTARVDSRYVAECFEKEHKNVIRDIRELDCSEEFRLLNFEPSYYKNQQGKKQPCYCMTRDGFVFLVMGYRGKKAAHFKEIYIRRFNEMEEHIKSLVSARQEFPLLTDNIKLAYDNPKPYHYSNECDMINRIVLGMTSKQYKIAHDIPSNESIRPYLSEEQIKLLDVLQKVDIGLLFSVSDYHKRKQLLESYVVRTNRSLITA